MFVVNDLTITLMVLIGVRFLGFLVFIELFLRHRESKYAVLALAWLAYSAGPVWGLQGYIATGDVDHPLFGYFAAVGTWLLMGGVLVYYRTISHTKLYTVIPLFIITLGLAVWVYPVLSGVFAVLAQLIFLLVILFIVVFKRKWFLSFGGNSYYWLLPIISVGLFHAFGFNFIYPEAPFSARLFLTFLINISLLIFFLHFEYNQSLIRIGKSEERFRDLYESAPIAYFTVNAVNGDISRSNLAASKLLGYDRDSLLSMKILDLYADISHGKLLSSEVVQQFKTGNPVNDVELQMQHKDGNPIWVSISIDPGYDQHGNIIESRLMVLDISERKQAEKSLKESHETLLNVLDSIDATIYVADMENYEILFMNKHMKEKFVGDFTGKICWAVFRHESAPCSNCTNDKLLDREGNPAGVQVWNDQNPVTGRWYINYDRAIKWTDGRYVRLQVSTDITVLKEMEEQLRQAQKMESIGTLAGGIAHDFNNILFPVLGYAEMLLEDVPEDSPFRASINGIYTSAMRAKSLVKQILTFSRQESGELMLMKMQPIVKEAIKLIRSTIPTTIEIKQDINPDCGVIKADPTQIHQIVMNLATNAYHAMEETGGELKVSLKEMELGTLDLINPDMTPGIYACLTVADTGKGMDKNLTDKIFDPFFTTKAIGKGTGMGLSVVHGIVTAMGGAIQVHSEPGKGTEFQVYLPVEKTLSEEQATTSKTQIQGGTEQILLVDDEEAILIMEKRMLERLGYQVTSRTSSLEALEAFRDSPDKFNLVITDMAMPSMPGDRLSVELTKIRPGISILLCTGFSENMSEERAASLGIKGFLFKPIVMKDLAQKIREVLEDN